MKNTLNKTKKLDIILLIIMSIQTIIMGLTFIVQVLRIYYGNNKTFTRSICSQYIGQILPVIIIWIILIIVNFIYFSLKNKPRKDYSKMTNVMKLHTLESIAPIVEDDNEIIKNLKVEKTKRLIFKISVLIIIFVCSIMGLLYLVNPKHFDSTGDLTQQAVDMAIHLMPWVIISFIVLLLNTIYEEVSSKKSIKLLQLLIKTNGKQQNNIVENKKTKLIFNIARCVILIFAIAFIIMGINNGGVVDVLQKAKNICTECIGLG